MLKVEQMRVHAFHAGCRNAPPKWLGGVAEQSEHERPPVLPLIYLDYLHLI